MEKIKLSYNSYSITVHRKQGDTDEKLVFLHGGALDNAMLSWQEVIELTGNRYDIYAIDMLGYGESEKPSIAYSMPMYVDLLHSVLQQLNIEKTHLAGLSMGGGISIAFSLAFPRLVDKLILVDAYGFFNRLPFHELCRWYVNSPLNVKSYKWFGKNKKLIRWALESTLIGDKNRISDELVDNLYNLVNEPEGNIAWVSFQRYEMGRKKVTSDLASHLNELKMPVLVVNGEKDPVVPVKSAINASKVINNCRLHIMKGCKHWPQKERPEEFARVLSGFLQESNFP